MGKKIKLLLTEKDREALQPLLGQLKAKGVRVSELTGKAGKKDFVLAALSAAFYADEAAVEKLLGLLGAGAENVLPLQLDGAPVPDKLKNVLYSRNIIPTAGREDAHTAERIVAAIPDGPKLPLYLTIGAVVLAVLAGVLIWNASRGETVPAMTQETPPTELLYPIPEGITPEELSKIRDVIIVGDQVEFYDSKATMENNYQTPGWDFYAYRNYDGDGPRWYSKEDGREYAMTRHEDLRFLALMPNLRSLTLALTDCRQLPELRDLEKLETVNLLDSDIADLEWLRDSHVQYLYIENSTGSLTDYSPLTSCRALKNVCIGLDDNRTADFSGFAPENLEELRLNSGHQLPADWDLPVLKDCKKLREVHLNALPLRDLSFLDKSVKLDTLELNDLDRLEDVSALYGNVGLCSFRVDGCVRLNDFSPLSGCPNLKSVQLCFWGDRRPRDLSFLNGLTKVVDLELRNVELTDLDFLRAIGSKGQSVELQITGSVGDLSALEAVKSYKKLELDLNDRADLDQIFSWLSEARIQELRLGGFSRVDLSKLPKVTSCLALDHCGITDLTGLPEGMLTTRLEIWYCDRLRSLEGLQNMSEVWRNGLGSLDVGWCPRMADWSALDGIKLDRLKINNCYTTPSFENLSFHSLELESIPGVTDLNFLNEMEECRFEDFWLIGMDELTSLEPLRRFRGNQLKVPPQLSEQAADLVKSGKFREFRVEFPQGGWSIEDQDFTLESLEELETLPPALLRHVTSVDVAGDMIFDPERFDVREDWSRRDKNGNPTYTLYDRETGEESRLKPGVITDLSVFSELTGLRRIKLYGQPIKSLDGIQAFSSLEEFTARGCPELRDASPLFAVQTLQRICLKDTAVESIQGLQNLFGLLRLDISRTKVTDLSPLAACDLSAAEQGDGLDLGINDLPLDADDFALLGGIRRYSSIAFVNQDPAIWIPALADCEINVIAAAKDFRSSEDLAAFAADHPELCSIYLGDNRSITDLSCLLGLENLEWVTVHRNMKQAIASLDGQDYSFHLEIQG